MPRKKTIEFEEEKDQEEEYEWDKTKLAITGVILLLLIGGFIFGRQYIFGDQASSHKSAEKISMGYAQESLLPSQEEVKQQLAAVEAKVSGLSVQDIATASPQVQQVLKQLQNLPKTPGDVVKQTCENICKGL